MSAQHTPGRQCDECEGHCLQPVQRAVDGRAVLSLTIGQHVRHRDYRGARVTGTIHGLLLDSEGVLTADIVLDAPIVIPASGRFAETYIHRQIIPAHELSSFDERDELIAELLQVAQQCEQRMAAQKWGTNGPREALPPEAVLLLDLRAAIAKATGGAS